MPELKHNFTQGIMNKDLDERGVPDGQYRDALNIQVSTSDGSNVGTAQTLMGNVKHNTINSEEQYGGYYDIPDTATVVGCVENRATDKIYYFVSSGDLNNSPSEPTISKDYIMQYDTVSEKHKHVFVDIFKVKVTVVEASASGNTFLYVPKGSDVTSQDGTVLATSSYNLTGIRLGMTVHGTLGGNVYTLGDNIKVSDIIYDSGNSSYKIYLEQNGAAFTLLSNVVADNDIVFEEERVLGFNKNNYIHSINVLDNFLLWTDSFSEPKKINIKRCLSGTGGFKATHAHASPVTGYATTTGSWEGFSSTTFKGDYPFFHTRLVKSSGFVGLGEISISGSEESLVVTQSDNKRVVYVAESHITVIKPSPTQSLEVAMYRTTVPRLNDLGEENSLYSTISGSSNGGVFYDGGNRVESGDEVTLTLDSGVDFRDGDRLKLIRQENNQESTTAFEEYDILVEVVSGGNNNGSSLSSNYTVKIVYISSEITSTSLDWYVAIDAGEALFEFKFPRFSYRYKYVDGEYSTFAPFSNAAFLSDAYDYAPEQGHNLGMTNQIRSLKVKGYHPQEFDMPQDVIEIDLLYKETNNPTVYIVKNIKPSDGHPIWPTQGAAFSTVSRGELVIETDTIYNTVASNQLLRPYDNVPRSAVTQDISANRLIYGNYLQSYTIEKEPDIIVGYDSVRTGSVDGDYAPPSVKSDRSYQVGVVFSDKYGRESAVVTSKNATVKVPHTASMHRNRLSVKLNSNELQIPSWAEYFSYYVKESSDEYYNLTMDRWYYTSDGNIWLSFPSSEINKLTEDSYITLKKAHGSSAFAAEKARYKVIDISKEVPNEVKTRKLNLGTLGVFDSGNSAIGSVDYGFPKVSSTFVTVTPSEFENAFGDTLHTSSLQNLRLVFFGPVDNKASQVYKVTNLSKSSLSGGKYKLKIEGAFEDDCEFILGEQQLTGNMRADLTMTLYADEVKMKPEYSGRFFVKIYKDDLLEKYILSQQAEIEQYEILATWGLRYIGNNGYVNAGTFSDEDEIPYNAKEFNDHWDNPSPNLSYSSNDISANGSDHPSEHNWAGYEYPEGSGNAAFTGIGSSYHWGGGTNGNDNTQNAFGITAADLNSTSEQNIGPVGALAGQGGGTTQGNAEAFWLGVAGSKDFFIDACTAYTWTGKGNQSDFAPNDDTPGNEWSNQGGAYHKDSQSFNNTFTAGQEEDQVAPEFVNHGKLAGNTGYRKGQPSRGIWNGGSCMDISWSGMGAGHVGGTLNEDDYPIAHQLKNVPEGGMYDAAWKFISKFVTPGTKFRFGRDPDATVYTTGSFRAVTVGNEQLGWANNSNSPGLDKDEDNDTWGFGDNKRYFSGTNKYTGVFGIRNFWTSNQNDQYYGHNLRQRWTVTVSPSIGSGPSGYNPTKGTDPQDITSNHSGELNSGNFRRALRHDGGFGDTPVGIYPTGNRKDTIEIVRPLEATNSDHYAADSGVWETEPNEVPDLDIYYQATGLNPIRLTAKTKENVIPIGATFKSTVRYIGHANIGYNKTKSHTVTAWNSDESISFEPAIGQLVGGQTGVSETDDNEDPVSQVGLAMGDIIINSLTINKSDGSSSTVQLKTNLAELDTSATIYGGVGTLLNKALAVQEHKLAWSNCWAFGNGVESDRIRDDFNAVKMDNGVKASAELKAPLKSERRKHGLIWSGMYNSTSGTNNINQFIMAEPITKDINPIYGSIQKLVNRNTRLIIFCEDKVLHAETNKDMLFNADGSSQVVASNKVVGSASAYQGNYGVGVSPESVVTTPHQVYFADPYRGHVLSLTGEGVRSISDKGMKDYFATKFSSYSNSVIGSYDERKGEYNLTISKKHTPDAPTYYEQTTLSFSEIAKGWTSFKSFTPSSGATMNNKYYTFYNGHVWKHHSNTTRNNFYGTQYSSDVTVLFNENAGGIKSWGAINYEGSKARTTNFDLVSAQMFNNNYSSTTGGASEGRAAAANVSDGEYYNLEPTVSGWYVDNITTNFQECGEIEFKDKEGKYFGYPSGATTTIDNLDEKEFSVQGLGDASIVHSDPSLGATITITVANNTSTTYETGGGSGGTDWDSIAD